MAMRARTAASKRKRLRQTYDSSASETDESDPFSPSSPRDDDDTGESFANNHSDSESESDDEFHDARDVDEDEARAVRGLPPVAVTEEPVVVPELESKTFVSWEACDDYIIAYAARTYQPLVVQTSKPIEARNRGIRERLEKKFAAVPALLERNLAVELIPESFRHYTKTIVCTHSGEPRNRPTKKKRVHQTYRGIGCPAKINLCAKLDKDTKTYVVKVTDATFVHNHEVSQARFAEYPKVRVPPDDDRDSVVNTLHTYGTSRKGILKYIVDNSTANPTMKDVSNLLAKLRKAKYADNPLVEDRVDAVMRDFTSEAKAVGRVFTDARRVVQAITLQTPQMRSMFAQFSQVMMIDATHNVNDQQYKLFSFMVHDALGNGQHVQHSLIENESKVTLTTVSEQFKSANPNWVDLKCVIIDKDFTEISAIETAFPGVRVLLCQWHVQKYLSEEVGKSKYGLSDFLKQSVRIQFRRLVGARSEVEYARRLDYIKAILGTQDKISAWHGYFDKNWDECKEKWCSYLRWDVPHLGNNTNNRLESSWHKLKGLVNKFTAMDECLISILFWQRSREIAWERNLKQIGVARVADADAELNKLAGVVSLYTFKLIRAQYDFAMKRSTKYQVYNSFHPMVFVKYQRPVCHDDEDEEESDGDDDGVISSALDDDVPDENSVDTRRWAVIPISKIHKRWLIAHLKLNEQVVPVDDDVERFQTQTMPAPNSRTLTSNERYNMLLEASKQIAAAGARFGSVHVRALVESLREIVTVVKDGDIPDVLRRPLPESQVVQAPKGLPNPQVLSQTHVVEDTQVLPASQALAESVILPEFAPLSDSQLGQPASLSQINALLDDGVIGQSDDDDFQIIVMPTQGNRRPASLPASTSPSPKSGKARATFTLSTTAPVPGRPRESKARRTEKKKAAQKESDKQFQYFERTGERATIAAFRELQGRRRVSYKHARLLVDALEVTNSYGNATASPLETKQPSEESELTFTYSIGTIERLEESMRMYIRRSRNYIEGEVTMRELVATVDKRSFSVQTLNIMRLIHSVREYLTLVDTAILWLDTNPDNFQAEDHWLFAPLEHKQVARRLKKLNLGSSNASILFFCANEYIDSDSVASTLSFIARDCQPRSIIALPPDITVLPDGSPELLAQCPPIRDLQEKYARAESSSLPVVLAALNFRDPDHWCAIVADLASATFYAFDPMQCPQRYSTLEWWCENAFEPAVKLPRQRKFSLHRFQEWSQLDGHNCGILVLLFLEHFARTGRVPDGKFSTSSLERLVAFARYRYLAIQLNDQS